MEMMTDPSNPSPKKERKTIEKNRRMQMKFLSSKLSSLIPLNYNSTKQISTQEDRLDQAARYIKELRQRVENLKERRKQAMDIYGMNKDMKDTMTVGSNLPILQLRDMGHGLEITLITEMNKDLLLSEVISIIIEEGAEVVNASVSVMGEKAFCTIHSKAISSRIGVDSASLCQRLKEIVNTS